MTWWIQCLVDLVLPLFSWPKMTARVGVRFPLSPSWPRLNNKKRCALHACAACTGWNPTYAKRRRAAARWLGWSPLLGQGESASGRRRTATEIPVPSPVTGFPNSDYCREEQNETRVSLKSAGWFTSFYGRRRYLAWNSSCSDVMRCECDGHPRRSQRNKVLGTRSSQRSCPPMLPHSLHFCRGTTSRSRE
jgi:hypothetical protein